MTSPKHITNPDHTAMSPNDQLFEFMQSQHETNTQVAASLARIEQSLEDSRQRLFGGDGQKGALPYLTERLKETETEVESLVRSRAVTKKVVAILVAVFTFINGALAVWFKGAAAK